MPKDEIIDRNAPKASGNPPDGGGDHGDAHPPVLALGDAPRAVVLPPGNGDDGGGDGHADPHPAARVFNLLKAKLGFTPKF